VNAPDFAFAFEIPVAGEPKPRHIAAFITFETRPVFANLSSFMQPIRIGCVSYLNAKPLIYGLSERENLRLTLDVPAKLIDGLRDHRFDVALLPIIDYQRLTNIRILTSGGIGCDGPTLTVRIFSKVPIDQIQTLACDTHSHSSVALARVLLAGVHGRHPEFVAFDHQHPLKTTEAVLLIGDKVVCEEPIGFQHQLDLGEAWKKMTGLPFVFAAWVARDDVELGSLPDQLQNARLTGMQHLHEIVERDAIPRGWPADLALRYMSEYLKYNIDDRQIQAIRLFHELAAEHGMIQGPLRELVVV
jgi:chorismate dehydratase